MSKEIETLTNNLEPQYQNPHSYKSSQNVNNFQIHNSRIDGRTIDYHIKAILKLFEELRPKIEKATNANPWLFFKINSIRRFTQEFSTFPLYIPNTSEQYCESSL